MNANGLALVSSAEPVGVAVAATVNEFLAGSGRLVVVEFLEGPATRTLVDLQVANICNFNTLEYFVRPTVYMVKK